MARKFDSEAFRVELSDGLSDSKRVRILAEALGRIYEELRFQLSSLGKENFRAGALSELASALGVARLWSSFEAGELIDAGTLIIYGGRIWRTKREVAAFSGAIYEGEDFESAS